jgi:hypothetical protein
MQDTLGVRDRDAVHYTTIPYLGFLKGDEARRRRSPFQHIRRLRGLCGIAVEAAVSIWFGGVS